MPQDKQFQASTNGTAIPQYTTNTAQDPEGHYQPQPQEMVPVPRPMGTNPFPHMATLQAMPTGYIPSLDIVFYWANIGQWHSVRRHAEIVYLYIRSSIDQNMLHPMFQLIHKVHHQIFLEDIERKDFRSAEHELSQNFSNLIPPQVAQDLRALLHNTALDSDHLANYKRTTLSLSPEQSVTTLREVLAREIFATLNCIQQCVVIQAYYSPTVVTQQQHPIFQQQAIQHQQSNVSQMQRIDKSSVADAIPLKKRRDTAQPEQQSPKASGSSTRMKVAHLPRLSIKRHSSPSANRVQGGVVKRRSRRRSSDAMQVQHENIVGLSEDNQQAQTTDQNASRHSSNDHVFVPDWKVQTDSQEKNSIVPSSVSSATQVQVSGFESGSETHCLDSPYQDENNWRDNSVKRRYIERRIRSDDSICNPSGRFVLPQTSYVSSSSVDNGALSSYLESVRSTSRPASRLTTTGVASTPAIRMRIREMIFAKESGDITWQHILSSVTGNRAKIWIAMCRFVDAGLLIQYGKGRRNHPYKYKVSEGTTEEDFIRLESRFQLLDNNARMIRAELRRRERKNSGRS